MLQTKAHLFNLGWRKFNNVLRNGSVFLKRIILNFTLNVLKSLKKALLMQSFLAVLTLMTMH